MIKKMHRISHKLTFSVVLAITCIFLLTTVNEYQKNMRTMKIKLPTGK